MIFPRLILLLLHDHFASIIADNMQTASQCKEDGEQKGHALLQREHIWAKTTDWKKIPAAKLISGGETYLSPSAGKTLRSKHKVIDVPSRHSTVPVPIVEKPVLQGSLAVPSPLYSNMTALAMHPLQPQVPDDFPFSFLHGIVGRDGVKLITMERTPARFDHSAAQLAKGGILATSFGATDASTASYEELRQGCIGKSDPNLGKCAHHWIKGCTYKAEQAIAESHRRALVAASLRKEDWTAILEDDMVLLDPHEWNSAFTSAWNKLQETSPEAKVVRLNWCMIVDPLKDFTNVFAETDNFTLTKWTSVDNKYYYSGQCTGAYMVHKDILPEMLGLFPCCEPLDNCYAVWYNQKDKEGRAHGIRFMVSMQSKQSRRKIADITGETWLGQHGVMYQDRQNLHSTKDDSEA